MMMMMETKTTTTTTKNALKKNKNCIWSKTGQKNTRKRMQIVLLSCVYRQVTPFSPSSPAFGPFICTSEESRISNNDEKLSSF